ncbi:MAG: hypothetical protein M3270_11375 [Thermoproteota archaeon]|nr:hypothetical protein [Thermoproteota archaeon]
MPANPTIRHEIYSLSFSDMAHEKGGGSGLADPNCELKTQGLYLAGM